MQRNGYDKAGKVEVIGEGIADFKINIQPDLG